MNLDATSVPGTNTFVIRKRKVVAGKAATLTTPLDFGQDCNAFFKVHAAATCCPLA